MYLLFLNLCIMYLIFVLNLCIYFIWIVFIIFEFM